MTGSLADAKPPRPWTIERADGRGRAGGTLRIGSRPIALDDIAGVAVERVAERDVKGLTVVAVGFALAASILLFGVADLGWRTRFLVGAGFLGAAALVSVVEVLWVNRIAYQRVHLTLVTGDTVVFASALPAEVDGLVAALAAR